jgi:hypothetical protein
MATASETNAVWARFQHFVRECMPDEPGSREISVIMGNHETMIHEVAPFFVKQGWVASNGEELVVPEFAWDDFVTRELYRQFLPMAFGVRCGTSCNVQCRNK